MALSGEFVKKPNQEVEYSSQDLKELDRCRKDPIYFINNYCWIQNQTHGRVRFKLRPYQIRIIKALHSNRHTILMIGRQSGKTETTAAYAYWFSIFKDDKNVLVASNKQKGATDIMNRIKFMYEMTPNWLRPGVQAYNRGSVEFDNGSKIWSEATTENTGRGRSVALFICDELAHVQKRIQQEMWASILPTISSGTGLSCVLMSTPNGDTDLFAELWRQAEADLNGFKSVYVDLSEVPGRDEKWQKDIISKIGELKFRQEFKCEFLSSDPLLINSMVLQRLKSETPLYVDKGFAFWKDPDPRKTYVIGVDVAEGVQQDFSTIQVIELDTLEQVAEYRNNQVKENQLYTAICWIIEKMLSIRDPRTRKRAQIYWSFENNSAGAAIGALHLNDEKFPEEAELMNGRGDRIGMRTGPKTKIEACRAFKNLVEKNKNGYVIRSPKLIFEMKNYVSNGASYAAKPGATDDLVSAMLIVTRVIKQLSEFEPEVFDKLYKEDSENFYDENAEGDYSEPVPFVLP